MKKTTEDLIEMVTVRLYNIDDTHIVHDILKNLAETFKEPADSYRSVKLCRNEQIENDWAIYIQHPLTERDGKKDNKSDLAVSLAEMLRDVGLVNHSIWKPCDTQDINNLICKPQNTL